MSTLVDEWIVGWWKNDLDLTTALQQRCSSVPPLHFPSQPHVCTEHCRKALEEDWKDAAAVGPTLEHVTH
jgi:hypothetical protein